MAKMKSEMDKIIIESRKEVSLLQNVVEIALASDDCNEEEKAVAKRISELLESMWYSW